MKSLLLRLSTLLGGVGLLVVAVGLRAGVAGFSSSTLGLVTSAYFVGLVRGTFFCSGRPRAGRYPAFNLIRLYHASPLGSVAAVC